MNTININSTLDIVNTELGSVLIIQGKQGGVTSQRLEGEWWSEEKKQIVTKKPK